MSTNRKNRIDQIEEKLKTLENTKWAKSLRISSSVIWNLFLLFIISALTLTVFGASVGAGYFASLVSKEPLRPKEEMRTAIFTYEETSEIYLAGNVYIGKVNSDIERKETKLENVSPFIIDAVYATEDEYFNEHNGIVPKAIFRGLFQDVTNSSNQTGGSTLTQQLIKNQILTNEVSYERKAKEILLAMRLEHFMNKEEILEAYLNIIPYGRNANGQNIAGVETAAGGIFAKKAKDLNLPQAAYISGLPQGPFAYTPYKSGGGLKEDEFLKPGIDRMKTVLFRMKETGYITDQQYNEAVAYDIKSDFRDKVLRANERYPYLTDEIQRKTIEILSRIIAEKDGIDPDRFPKEKKLRDKYGILATRSMQNDGFRIYSTVNKDLYDKMNKISDEFEYYGFTYTREVNDPDTGEVTLKDDPVQVGAMMIENTSGKILSFVGGRDHDLEAYNHSTQAFRQNGSAMKPLLVYAPAIEYGVIGAGSPVVDVKFNVRQGDGSMWSPSNYTETLESGIIPAREALAKSLNLATARLYRDIIDRRPAEFLDKMGISQLVPGDYVNYSTSYGGMDVGMSVEENTNAYATFANGGKFVDGYLIEKIEDMDGNIVFQHETKPVDVFSPETSYIITDMLRDVLKPGGTGVNLAKNLNFNIDLAAKTGTTQGYGDAWLVGYNPNVSLGVWLGYKDRTRSLYYGLERQTLHPSDRTSRLFARFMNAANEVVPDIVGASSKFQQPKSVVTQAFCGISGLAPSTACASAGLVRSDLFNSKVMLPNQPDDSIVSSSYVLVNGTRYMALASTPSEFITGGGTGVNADFIERMLGPWKGDASKLFSSKSGFSSGVVSGAIFDADASNPAAVNVVLDGSSISWSNSASTDVIGYYVYRDGARIGTVRESSANSYSIGSGSYTVRAVDITGRLSGSSNAVTVEAPEPVVAPDEVEPNPETTPGTPSTPGTTPGITPPPSNPGGENPGNGPGTTPPSDDDGED